MKALVDRHFVEPWVRTRFLALVSRLWFIKELAPVVLIFFGHFWVFLFALISNGTFGGFEWDRPISELWNPPLPDLSALIREPLQALENAQEIFRDVGMSIHRVFRNEGSKSM